MSSNHKKRNVIIYCRVSSKNQFIEGVSLQVQQEKCTKYCREKGYTIKDTILEVASAKKIQKQKKLLHLAKRNDFDALIIYDVSRFSRNVTDGMNLVQRLSKRKIYIESITENLGTTNSFSYEFTIVSLLNNAEYQLKQMIQKIKESRIKKESMGHCFGKCPYGYKVQWNKNIRNFIEDEYQQKVIDFIRSMKKPISLSEANEKLKEISKLEEFVTLSLDDESDFIENGLTFENIADILNDYDVDYNGKEWNRSNVYSVCSK